MSLDAIAGQPRAVQLLKGACGAVSHAYLFVGPDRVGKRTTALAFAQAVNCLQEGSFGCGNCRECLAIASGNHPDVRVWDVLEGEKTFKIEQVRELIGQVAWHPYQGRRKVHVLAAMDAINAAGANALLKTLEEPPAATTLVLLARSLDTVLPTLVSRCQVVPFGLTPPEAIAQTLLSRFPLPEASARDIAFRSQGRMGLAFELSSQPPETIVLPEFPQPGDEMAWTDALVGRGEAEQTATLDALLAWLRDLALAAAGSPVEALRHREAADRLYRQAAQRSPAGWVELAQEVEVARDRLARHANARLVLDGLARDLAGVG